MNKTENQKSASTGSNIFGGAFLTGILLFGLGGVAVYALEEDEEYQPDELYIDECGACHYAYPPGLLPAQSWQTIMTSLDDHFEENAETDDETVAYVSEYLLANALEAGQPSKWSVLARNLPSEPPLRIVELPGFKQAHESELELIEGTNFDITFFSPCEDCHRQAPAGRFDKELLSKGYGPAARVQR